MPLLHLPPEIFQHIVHDLSSVVGMGEVWKLRGVCRTFAREIAHDVLARQPMQTLEREGGGTILRHNLDVFLLNRLNTPYDANPVLLDQVRAMGDFLATTQPDSPLLLERLCQSLTKRMGSSQLLYSLQRPPPRHSSSQTDRNSPVETSLKMMAAILVDATDLVRALLPALSETSHWRMPYFQSPLVCAIKHHNTEIVQSILEFLAHPGIPGLPIQDALRGNAAQLPLMRMDLTILGEAIKQKQPDVLKVVIEYHTRHVGPLPKTLFNECVSMAIQSGVFSVVQPILDLKHAGLTCLTKLHLIEAANAKCPKIMLRIARGPGIGINKRYVDGSPLVFAIQAGNLRVVEALLDAGADPNMNFKVGGKTKSVFEIARGTGERRILRVLRKRGAQT